VSTLPIETERLRIRHFTADDWRAVHAYTRDAGVMTYVPKGVMTEEETKQFIAGSMADEARTYAVDLRAEDRLIGHVGFHPWYAPASTRSAGSFIPTITGGDTRPRPPRHSCDTASSPCPSTA
jgi:RimJ/RimL family protein N-acetyltransferase